MKNTTQKHILIIDDDRAIRESLEIFLQTENLKTTQAQNGLIGKEFLLSGLKPDLILLDVNMPIMTGIEFLEDSFISTLNIPIVVMTASPSNANMIKNRIILAKPFSPTSLLNIIDSETKSPETLQVSGL